jgi:hypothetical protein
MLPRRTHDSSAPRHAGIHRTIRSGSRIVALALLTLAAACGTASAGTLKWRSGAFVGYGGAGLSHFAAWRGAPVQTATDYIGSDNWGEIEDPAWAISQWAADRAVGPDLSVAMWPATGGSLSAAASGAYNSYFTTLANNLVAGGLGSVSIRLGWEFNGSGYRCSVGSASGAAEFAAAWRQIVTAMRAEPGANFSFDWCPNLQAGGVNPALAYPGDAYVSDIGMDVYDWNETASNETATERWGDLVHRGYGLAWQASFAAAHGKPIAFPEWGLVSDLADPAAGGGDDPSFVQNMFNWFGSHDVSFEDYFDTDAPGIDTDYGLTTGNGQFPNAVALYQKLYSGGVSTVAKTAGVKSAKLVLVSASSRSRGGRVDHASRRATRRRARRRRAHERDRHARRGASHKRHRRRH